MAGGSGPRRSADDGGDGCDCALELGVPKATFHCSKILDGFHCCCGIIGSGERLAMLGSADVVELAIMSIEPA